MIGFKKNNNNKTWEESEDIITDFLKEKLGVKEDISIERAHHMGNIQRNDGTRNKNKIIVVKFNNFKDKSRVINTYRQKILFKEKIFLNNDFGGDSQHFKDLLQKARNLRLQNKVANIVHDRLISYEKERGSYIFEAQGDP